METEKLCPRCGGPAQSDLACHTYPQRSSDGKERWMACMPCDSATLWTCALDYAYDEETDEDIRATDEMCRWRWTEGLNPNNPRFVENEVNNPRWS